MSQEAAINSSLSSGGDARLDHAHDRLPSAPAMPATEMSARSLVGRTISDVERDLILETLKHCRGNRTRAAELLDISVRTLRNKLRDYAGDGVAVPRPGRGCC
jgi:two-component system, response regulator FlrC